MLDRVIEELITDKYGSNYENAYDISPTYDDFHASLNFYRIYESDENIVVIRMSGKNILLSEKAIAEDVLISTHDYRKLTEEEKMIYKESQEERKYR